MSSGEVTLLLFLKLLFNDKLWDQLWVRVYFLVVCRSSRQGCSYCSRYIFRIGGLLLLLLLISKTLDCMCIAVSNQNR